MIIKADVHHFILNSVVGIAIDIITVAELFDCTVVFPKPFGSFNDLIANFIFLAIVVSVTITNLNAYWNVYDFWCFIYVFGFNIIITVSDSVDNWN